MYYSSKLQEFAKINTLQITVYTDNLFQERHETQNFEAIAHSRRCMLVGLISMLKKRIL